MAYRKYLGAHYDGMLAAARAELTKDEQVDHITSLPLASGAVPSTAPLHQAGTRCDEEVPKVEGSDQEGEGHSPSSTSAASTAHRSSIAEAAAVPDRLPFFILGCSMGGATACLLASDGSARFDGVILIAPMCGFDAVSTTLRCCKRMQVVALY